MYSTKVFISTIFLLIAFLAGYDFTKTKLENEALKENDFCNWAKPVSATDLEYNIIDSFREEKNLSISGQLPNIINHLDWYDEQYYNRCS